MTFRSSSSSSRRCQIRALRPLGTLVENRPKIFHYLEKIIKGFDNAIQNVRNFVERLDIALKIKTDVFGYLPQYVNYRADVDEIKSKMGNYPYLASRQPIKRGRCIPLGVVHSTIYTRPLLGTVTLRDFCNREETKIPSYLEVISVIDHHKSSLNTASAPMAIISDAQSSNVLCAEMAFAINDRFGTGGMTKANQKQGSWPLWAKIFPAVGEQKADEAPHPKAAGC